MIETIPTWAAGSACIVTLLTGFLCGLTAGLKA